MVGKALHRIAPPKPEEQKVLWREITYNIML